MPENKRHMKGNHKGHALVRPENTHNRRLAIQKSGYEAGHMSLLDIKRQARSV